MADRQYARKRLGLSWHVVAFHTRGLNSWKAMCSRPVFDPTVEIVPWNEPSCESCLRIVNRLDEQAAERVKFEREPEDDGSTSLTDATDVP
jgi:hypothetical protein